MNVITAVADTSALLHYATRDAVAFGELLTLLGEEDDRLVVSTISLAQAYATGADPAAHALLDLLGSSGVVIAEPLAGIADAQLVGALAAEQLGPAGIGTVHAVLLARRHGVPVVTADPATLAKLPSVRHVIDLDAGWD